MELEQDGYIVERRKKREKGSGEGRLAMEGYR